MVNNLSSILTEVQELFTCVRYAIRIRSKSHKTHSPRFSSNFPLSQTIYTIEKRINSVIHSISVSQFNPKFTYLSEVGTINIISRSFQCDLSWYFLMFCLQFNEPPAAMWRHCVNLRCSLLHRTCVKYTFHPTSNFSFLCRQFSFFCLSKTINSNFTDWGPGKEKKTFFDEISMGTLIK